MDVIKKRMSDLRCVKKNVRRHPETQLKELERSYEMFGQYRPLIVTHDGEVLVGNGLFTALSRIGVEEVDCIVLPADTPEKYKQKLMLSDNKIFELGANDVVNIDELLSELNDFQIPGFDEKVLEELYAFEKESEGIIDNMFIVDKERVEQINKVAEIRATEPPKPLAEKPSKFEPASQPASQPVSQPVVPETSSETPAEKSTYVTCPHCGMKIWVS